MQDVQQKDIVVIGLGNPLMADEGIGIEVLRLLAGRFGDTPNIDFIDAGTGGFSLLHHLAGRKKACIIDCAIMDQPPGTIRMFTLPQVKTKKILTHQSVHQADIIRIAELSVQLDNGPADAVFFGIEPHSIQQQSALSAQLASRLEEYTETIGKQLKSMLP